MSSTRAALVLAAAALVTLGLGVVALELVFGQWLRDANWSRVERMNVVRDRRITYDVRHILGPAAEPVRYTRDHYGLRGDCASIDQMQIVTLGGSTTDQVYIDDDATWQQVLQRHLNGTPAGQRICVANAGVDGHTTFGHIMALRHWLPLIPALKPRFVMLYLGINDAGIRLEKGAFDEAAERTPEGSMARIKHAIKDNSALYRAWSALSRRAQGVPVFAAHRLIEPKEFDYTSDRTTEGIEPLVAQNAEAFRLRLRTIVALIEQLGSKPICVSQPSIIYKRVEQRLLGIPNVFAHGGKNYNGLDYRHSLLALNQVMAQECPRAGGHYIDLESKPFVATDFYDGVHMTPAGAARVGRYLFEEFQRQGVLETRAVAGG